jgi:hypothetical protein
MPECSAGWYCKQKLTKLNNIWHKYCNCRGIVHGAMCAHVIEGDDPDPVEFKCHKCVFEEGSGFSADNEERYGIPGQVGVILLVGEAALPPQH